MRLLHCPLPLNWVILGWVVLLPFAVLSLRRVRAGVTLGGAQQHLWLAGVVLLAWLWTLQARAVEGAAFGLLGAAFYALVFGRDWARLGLLAAVALQATFGSGGWANAGLTGLLLAALPTALAGALQRQLEHRLPKNLFVFIIGNGFFVTLTVTAATSVALLAAAGMLQPETDASEQIGYALLLAWGEALVSGMLFSALVVFGPALVLTYRQDLYLPRRGL